MKIARMNTDDVNRLGLSRILPLLGLATCLSAAVSCADPGHAGSGQKATAPEPVPVTITWAMAERFGPGYDRNGDGHPDVPNSDLLEYPDPTGDATGATARAILNELVPGVQVNRRELDLASERLLRPLNQALNQAADRQGWSFVGGISDSFRSHGYAAADTWFVRAKESEQLQGPLLSLAGYLRGRIATGTLHPNRRGHQVIADRLFQSLAARRKCHWQ